VLATVEFDNERLAGTHEIRDKVAEGNLAAEFPPQQAPVAEPRPEAFLDFGLVCAQTARHRRGHAQR
jgi:hypothetical protein